MRSEKEKEYLLKAIDAFQRRIIVISPDFLILAASFHTNGREEAAVIGEYCYKAIYGREEPCEACAVENARQTKGPAIRTKESDFLDQEKLPCLYAYPITTEDGREAFVSMDFDLPSRREIEERLQRSNAFLRNLILSAVDGVIAADMNGKIIIFNETAGEIFGYSVGEALENLNIRQIYPDQIAFGIMRKLRSDDYGGKGKLQIGRAHV